MKIIHLKNSNKLMSALRVFWGNLRKQDRNAPELNKILFLKSIPLFQSLRQHQLNLVAQIIHEREYNENEFLFEQGQPGAAVFILQGGEVSVEIPNPAGETIEITRLKKFSFVGELALLDDSPRSASARATQKTNALALFRHDLDKIQNIDPEVSTHIYRSLAQIIGQRLKATNELLENKIEAA